MVSKVGMKMNQNPFLKSAFSLKIHTGKIMKDIKNQDFAKKNLMEKKSVWE